MALLRQFSRMFSDIGTVAAYRNNTVTLTGMENAKVGSFVRIGGQYTGFVCALFKYNISAIILQTDPQIEIGQESELLPDPPLRVAKPEYRHKISNERLNTGFWQIDVLTPILKGQFAVFSGKPNTGKVSVARATIENFLNENSSNQVVIIGDKIQMNDDRIQTFSGSSPGEKFISSYNAINSFPKDRNVLLVVDDLFDVLENERQIMTAVHPGLNLFNLIGHLFEQSKVSNENASLTTLGIINFGGDWDRGFLRDLDSVVTKRVKFGSEKDTFKRALPQIDFTACRDINDWAVDPATKELRMQALETFEKLDQQKSAEDNMQSLQIHIDPWDQYLLLDSKHFLKLMCQDKPLSKMHQSLFLRLCMRIIREELSSRIKLDMTLARRIFLNFITTAKADTEAVVDAFIEKLDSEGLLSEFAEDYMDTVKKSPIGKASEISRHLKQELKNREFFKEEMERVGLYRESQ